MTARDVARTAGVSAATVDRVLNQRGGVTAEKERAVLSAARRLGLDRALDQRAARTLRIAVLTQPPGNPFHAVVGRAFEAAGRANPQFNMQFRQYHIDPADAAGTARRIVDLAPEHDAIVLVAAHDPKVGRALAAFRKAGKPVITFATDLGGIGPHLYVGPDNMRAGRMAGHLMARLMGRQGGDVLVIAGMMTMIGHAQRVAGFRAVLAERHPQIRLVAVVESREDPSRAGDLVFQALKQHPGLAGIYNVSAGAQPVVDALRGLARQGETVFITHELTEDRRHLLREGLIDAILDQDPLEEVRVAVAALAAHFGRAEAAPASLVTPVHIHMIENC